MVADKWLPVVNEAKAAAARAKHRVYADAGVLSVNTCEPVGMEEVAMKKRLSESELRAVYEKEKHGPGDEDGVNSSPNARAVVGEAFHCCACDAVPMTRRCNQGKPGPSLSPPSRLLRHILAGWKFRLVVAVDLSTVAAVASVPLYTSVMDSFACSLGSFATAGYAYVGIARCR